MHSLFQIVCNLIMLPPSNCFLAKFQGKRREGNDRMHCNKTIKYGHIREMLIINMWETYVDFMHFNIVFEFH